MFVNLGVVIVIVDLNEDGVKVVVKEIIDVGGKVIGLCMDVIDE